MTHTVDIGAQILCDTMQIYETHIYKWSFSLSSGHFSIMEHLGSQHSRMMDVLHPLPSIMSHIQTHPSSDAFIIKDVMVIV